MVLAATALTASLRAATLESGETQTTLVELYTSEGCSSCPPAEARLAKLRDEPGLWKQIVPVAFHVGYWDRLILQSAVADNTSRHSPVTSMTLHHFTSNRKQP